MAAARAADRWTIILWLSAFVVLGRVDLVCVGRTEEVGPGPTVAATEEPFAQSDQADDEPTEKQQLKAKALRLALIVMIVVVITLFVVILLLTIVRIGRLRRRRTHFGEKAKPTEYIDAWSQYRLEDDSDQTDLDEP